MMESLVAKPIKKLKTERIVDKDTCLDKDRSKIGVKTRRQLQVKTEDLVLISPTPQPSNPVFLSPLSSSYSESEPSSPLHSLKSAKLLQSFEEQLENLNRHFSNESAIKISIANLEHLVNQIFESQDEHFIQEVMQKKLLVKVISAKRKIQQEG